MPTGDEEDPVRTEELLSSARDTLTVRRVYGEPYERDGVTVITAAAVGGGGGGGEGHDASGQEGEGGGFGMSAKPAGVYVVADGKVQWQPAVDVNRLAATIALAVIAVAFARVRLARVRTREE